MTRGADQTYRGSRFAPSRGGHRGRGRGRGSYRGGYENSHYLGNSTQEREKNPFPMGSELRKPLPNTMTEGAEMERFSGEQYGLPDQMQKAKSLLPEDTLEGATSNIQSQILNTLNEQEKKMI